MTLICDKTVKRRNKKVAFRNTAPISIYISKISNRLVNNAGDLDIEMPMYSNNYSMTSGSLWNYFRDEVNDAANEVVANYWNNNITTRQQQVDFLNIRQN